MARPPKGTTLKDRIYNHAVRSGECLLFKGHLDELGYGRVQRGYMKGLVRTHRAVWEMEYGPIPQGKVIMHLCDVRNCIELSHLRMGTQLENIQDRQDKGRNRGMPYLCDVVW